MTLHDLDAALKEICADTYELAAPPGLTRYIVWARYGSDGILGDDSTALTVPRVQIDVLWQNPVDALPDAVEALLEDLHLPYEEVSRAYDDDYAQIRMILQLTVI